MHGAGCGRPLFSTAEPLGECHYENWITNAGGEKKRWEDNVKEWTGMDFASSIKADENMTRWKGIVAKSSVMPQRPSKAMGKKRKKWQSEV